MREGGGGGGKALSFVVLLLLVAATATEVFGSLSRKQVHHLNQTTRVEKNGPVGIVVAYNGPVSKFVQGHRRSAHTHAAGLVCQNIIKFAVLTLC